MAAVAAAGQETVADSGVLIRMQAVRTEKDQVRYQPLQPYQERTSIIKRCRAWQQMLAFFVRTQQQRAAGHEAGPAYRFNQRQAAAFQRMMAAAELAADDSEAGASRHEEAAVEEEEEEQEEEEEEEAGDETAREERSDKAGASPRGCVRLTGVPRACLDFCIELLNQTISRKEYDCALICAAAVLGVDAHGPGWRDAGTYPPILSAIIKVAQFMVMQKAMELDMDESDEAGASDEYSPGSSPCSFGSDSGYGSDTEGGVRRGRHRSDSPSSNSPSSESRDSDGPSRSRRSSGSPGSSRTSIAWVQAMVDSFMVRRTNSPMDWFLDLRTYGMKIHYNTTAAGHIMWKDHDVLQYRDIAFSMAEFRGMVHHLHETTRQTLLQDVLFGVPVGEMPTSITQQPDVRLLALHTKFVCAR